MLSENLLEEGDQSLVNTGRKKLLTLLAIGKTTIRRLVKLSSANGSLFSMLTQSVFVADAAAV